MKVVLCDYSWLAHRYFHAYGDKMSVILEGEKKLTGQHFGFGRLVQSLDKWDPTAEVIFCVDMGSDKRLALFPEYKTGREDSSAVYETQEEVKKMLCLSQNVRFAQAQGFEADDLLAQLFFEYQEKSYDVTVHSGDDDMMQLVSYGAHIFRKFDHGRMVLLGEEYVQEKYGVPSNLLIRYRVMCGDGSDGIPAVVPRLNREFIMWFIREWEAKGLVEALELKPEGKYGEYMDKVRAGVDNLNRNIALMNLTKYRKPEERFKVEFVRAEGGEFLVRQLQLWSFWKFLRTPR